MILKKCFKISGWLCLLAFGSWFFSALSSCGKAATISANGLNIRYQVLNLSPDMGAVNLYTNFFKESNTPYVFNVNQGYFNITALDTPYRIRSVYVNIDTVLLSRHDLLARNTSYSLFLVGDVTTNSLTSIFTVDTSKLPAVGRGKVRFVNASPTGKSGIDIYANGTKAFSNIAYPKATDYIEIPNGNYDFQINPAGSATSLKTLLSVKIQDGRLYTLYTYGYSNRIDSAAFSAAIITNR